LKETPNHEAGMEKVRRLVDKQMDMKLKQEIDACLKRIRALEAAFKFHREKLKELCEGRKEELAEELGIIKGKTGETISVLFLLEKTNELIEDTIVLWGEGVRKSVQDYMRK
jgi:hypothetical protein